MTPQQRIAVARVLGPHGVRGRLRLQSFTEEPTRISSLGPLETENGRSIKIEIEGTSRDALIVQVPGIATREAAEGLKGAFVYAPRTALPEPEPDEYYEADLVGLTVMDGERDRGKVIAVASFGASPLLEVAPIGGGATVYIPFSQAVVPEIDLKSGRIRVELPEGLWPED